MRGAIVLVVTQFFLLAVNSVKYNQPVLLGRFECAMYS